ncbi:unnamed protein product [Adineta ricciae]|uniref:Uncharacterized protein n=2 Tax=Adineta ricciae TaxID=249248 RepID=A0A815M5E8_ADIRI|nr:unnamed protein product [Adineta ricciae]
MQSASLEVTIINGKDCCASDVHNTDLSTVRHVKLTRVAWIRGTFQVLINSTMRERLGLELSTIVTPDYLASEFTEIVASRGPHPLCKMIYIVNLLTGNFYMTCPTFVADLPVDFVLGTMYFGYFDRGFRSGRLIILSEERDRRRQQEEEELRRQAYKNIL